MKAIARFFRRDVRRALNSLAYAHTGEMLPTSVKGHVLSGSETGRAGPAQPTAQTAPETRGRVALALEGRVNPDALRYAMQAAVRFDADLDVLTSLSERQVNMALGGASEDSTGSRRVLQLESSDILSGIAEYTRRHPETLLIITSADDNLTERYVADRPAGWNLQVPWIVVSDQSRAA